MSEAWFKQSHTLEILRAQRTPLIKKLSPGTYHIGVFSSKSAKPAFVTVSGGKAP
jgi:hypothetical protein